MVQNNNPKNVSPRIIVYTVQRWNYDFLRSCATKMKRSKILRQVMNSRVPPPSSATGPMETFCLLGKRTRHSSFIHPSDRDRVLVFREGPNPPPTPNQTYATDESNERSLQCNVIEP